MVQRASQCFAVEVLSFAVMDNHMHIVAKGQPARAMQWDDRTVAERWAALWPKRNPETRELEPWSEERIAMLAADSLHCITLRKRLMSISWFMRLINEPVAKRANREDTCTGHFWEGRFRSVKLLDAAALVSCMAYVDLNPIRAKMADRPEDSDYTSIRARIQARQAHKKTLGLADIYGKTAALTPAMQTIITSGPEHGLWIAPMDRCHTNSPDGVTKPHTLSLDDYIELVETTGRIIRNDKRGAIPDHLLPILQRLDIDAENWIKLMSSHNRFLGAAIGHAIARTNEAIKRGVKWIRNTMGDVFINTTNASPPQKLEPPPA